MKCCIALDVGDRRIGVAKSDILGIIASPLEVIDRKKENPIERIKIILEENDTKKLVVGIPKSLDGSEKVQAEKVRKFIEKLKSEIENINVIEIDERYTTKEAEKYLNETTSKGALEKRKVIDKIAASIILQKYLDKKYNM